VRDEILPTKAVFADAAVLARTLAEGWIEVTDLPPDDWKLLNPGIDVGEASAIRVACHWRDAGEAVLLVMDDRAGRLEAKRQGLALTGTAGVIGLAKTEGLIKAARPLLERLAQSGYYLGQAVLAEVGE
jgi:predicted nucleic acid-binding protein